MSKFHERLAALGFSSYKAYLSSPHWTGFKRRFATESKNPRCLVCGIVRYELHHCTYKRIGGERIGDVIPLCRDHHEAVHDWLKAKGRNLGDSMLRKSFFASLFAIKHKVHADVLRKCFSHLVFGCNSALKLEGRPVNLLVCNQATAACISLPKLEIARA